VEPRPGGHHRRRRLCLSLLAGQGASLALAGSRALATALRTHGDDMAAGLATYERGWRPVTTRQQAAGRRNATFFIPKGRTGQVLRRAALRFMALPGIGGPSARRIFRASLPSKGHPEA